jgi:hypothetical protein
VSTHHSGAPAPQSERSRIAARPLTAAQICGITVFPLMGAGLALAGVHVSDVLTLLAGCGGIGAATIAAVGTETGAR